MKPTPRSHTGHGDEFAMRDKAGDVCSMRQAPLIIDGGRQTSALGCISKSCCNFATRGTRGSPVAFEQARVHREWQTGTRRCHAYRRARSIDRAHRSQ